MSLFHHALGQTPGFLAFADEIRQVGHTVHTPDLFGGSTFETIDDGMAYAEEIGFGEVRFTRHMTAAVNAELGALATWLALGDVRYG